MTETDLQRMTDVNLVVAVARWRQDALEEVYRRHAGPVYALACRVCGDRDQAADVTQEVFVAFWNDPERFDSDRANLRSYLMMLAHSRSVDLVRSESSRRRREAGVSAFEAVVDELEREVLDLAMAEEVKAAFAELPQAEQEAINLAYFEGRTYREAARLLNQPEGTVKSRIRSGLRRMHGLLVQTVEEP